jgi:hypothetical protein
MSDKTKGWTFEEIIGVSIVNPGAVTSMKAVPGYTFNNEGGSIEIRRHALKITGAIESAALAFANDILKRGKFSPEEADKFNLNYMNVIEICIVDNKYTLNLLQDGVHTIHQDQWNLLKKHVEKICNDLTAFI